MGLCDLGENQTIPCNELAEVAAEIIGGNGIISGQWMINGIPNAETSLFLEEQLTESGMISYSASDQCGQNATDSVAIWLEFIPLTADSAAFSLCEAEEFFIEVIANGGNGVLSYQWPFGIGSEGEWVTIDASQSWEVLVTDECGQTASASILVELTVLSADFSASDTGNGSYLFEVEQTCDACTYEWDFGDGSFSEFGESVSHSFDGATEYITTLMVDNEVGCSAEQFFVVQPTIFLYIPTSFTPDGDGLNEAFYVVATGFVSFQLTIYNRWGEQIFYTEDLNQGWIGNFQNGEYYVPNGTYLYDVLCIDPYGVPVRRQGPLTLIR
jgi:gliding motility-associated-like protein